ncbi:MAG TPA: hypothetical protein VHB21_27065 [Minicystis sp.]|nr:hypothetical protein [Minicystis sp.]
MRRSVAAFAAALLLASASAACTGTFVDSRGVEHKGAEDDAEREAAVQSAAADIPCDASAITVDSMGYKEAVNDPKTLVLSGCGSRVTYLETCLDVRPNPCKLALTSRVKLP